MGLTPDALSRVTTREYCALADVQRESKIQWAIERVWYAEAHRNPKDDDMPWEVDDFLISGHRESRRGEHNRNQRAIEAENQWLQSIPIVKPGEKEPDWVPEWARKEKRI